MQEPTVSASIGNVHRMAAGAHDEPAIAVACYRMTDHATMTAASDDLTRFDQFTLAHPRSNHRRLPA